MYNPETPATLATQYTERRQANIHNRENKKDEHHEPHQKPGMNPGTREGCTLFIAPSIVSGLYINHCSFHFL
jgi:hypothetical protein